LPWTMFSAGLSRAGNSVLSSQALINKIYFNRLILPLSSIGPAVLDFCIVFSMLILLMIYYGIAPSWSALLLPLPLLALALAALGAGMVLAALSMTYRDIQLVITFFVQLLMFATPTIYMDPNLEVERGTAEQRAASASAIAETPQGVEGADAQVEADDSAKAAAPLVNSRRGRTLPASAR